jgi:hypothetical protein
MAGGEGKEERQRETRRRRNDQTGGKIKSCREKLGSYSHSGKGEEAGRNEGGDRLVLVDSTGPSSGLGGV